MLGLKSTELTPFAITLRVTAYAEEMRASSPFFVFVPHGEKGENPHDHLTKTAR